MRPQVVGRALAEIQRVPEVAEALFALLEIGNAPEADWEVSATFGSETNCTQRGGSGCEN